LAGANCGIENVFGGKIKEYTKLQTYGSESFEDRKN
tara:strand:+ start:453 stop:560 length:108 start_codon:yes stop_codon:yes gene_type:complete